MDGGEHEAAAAFGQRAVALGILTDAAARTALDEYRRRAKEGPRSFGEFLLASGMLSREDLDELAPARPDGQPEPPDPLVGTTVGGCAIARKLGQGGMGSVYLARRLADGAQVVVNLLAAEKAQNKTWRGRFEREARVLEHLVHPNLVAVHSVDAACERPHMVMEFVDGEPLDVGLSRLGAYEPLEAARIARDIARGLAEAHRSGVIHRDLKPA